MQYCFPFAPNPDWTSFYVSGGEILQYMEKTVDKFDLRSYVQVSSKVTSATWSEEKGKWQLQIERCGETIHDEVDVLINGAGFLNSWQWPDIPDLKQFKGELVHSANWQAVAWKDKKVALIGNGSSAIQILPEIQRTAKSIHTYIRTPTWIIPNMLADMAPEGKNFAYSDEDKKRFREHPEELKKLRQKMEHVFNEYFFLFFKDSPQQAAARGIFADLMKQKLGGDTELAQRLIPDFPVGCRRITPGDGYLDALTADNVTERFDPIVRFTQNGILTQPPADAAPEETEFDLIICATGFDVTFKPLWPMKGLNGVSLQELWKDESEAYMGIAAPQMPNYFMFTGAGSPLGHGSLFGALDASSDYILKWCSKIAGQGIKSVTVKGDVLREFNDYSQAFLQKTVWSSGCRSWYKNHKVDGRVSAMYAGSVLHYRELLEAFRTEDFDINYLDQQNRFGFMGSGITDLEASGGQLGFYLDK